MKAYTLQVDILSPTLIGSGEGFGATIDTDIVFDDVGLPLLPAKRIKGCLRDAALEVQEMLCRADMQYQKQMATDIKRAFGEEGQECSAPVYFSNLTLEQYIENYAWLNYFLQQDSYPDMLSRENILNTFTMIRQQTKINADGVAEEHSLRTIRVLKPGVTFSGEVVIADVKNHDRLLTVMLLGAANLRAIGTKRNRGLGDVCCRVLDAGKPLSIQDRWEEMTQCTI